MEIKGCAAIITGGASGLGEACVRTFAENGANVMILDLSEERGSKVAEELGECVKFTKTNVSEEERVQKAVEVAVRAFGAIRVVVNCAGIGIPAKVLGKEGPMSMRDFERVLQVNLNGTMNVIRFAAQKMTQNDPNEEGERGVIVNTSSIAAFEGQIGQASYAASKAAIAGITLPLAREFAQWGIRVVTVAPGIFDTPMLQELSEKVRESLAQMVPFPSRLGRPSEFAMLVKHIVKNPMLNGTTIRLDAALRMAGK